MDDMAGRTEVPGPALPGAGHVVDLLDGFSIVPSQVDAGEGAAVGAGGELGWSEATWILPGMRPVLGAAGAALHPESGASGVFFMIEGRREVGPEGGAPGAVAGREKVGATLILARTVRGAGERAVWRAGRP